jgi:hypothetical protein
MSIAISGVLSLQHSRDDRGLSPLRRSRRIISVLLYANGKTMPAMLARPSGYPSIAADLLHRSELT